MARLPTRTQSRRLFSSLSVAFFLLVAVLCFTAPSVKAEEPHAEYGTVIGIGASVFPVLPSISLLVSYRSGDNVCIDLHFTHGIHTDVFGLLANRYSCVG